MLLAGINFALHFLVWRSLSLGPYRTDSEFKAYLVLLGAVCVISCTYLIYSGTYDGFAETLRQGIFQSVAIATTTGFTTTEFQAWPSFLPVMLLFASFGGACAGSTGGGLKVIRVLLLFKQGLREIKRLIHPNAIIPIKIGGRPLPDRIMKITAMISVSDTSTIPGLRSSQLSSCCWPESILPCIFSYGAH